MSAVTNFNEFIKNKVVKIQTPDNRIDKEDKT